MDKTPSRPNEHGRHQFFCLRESLNMFLADKSPKSSYLYSQTWFSLRICTKCNQLFFHYLGATSRWEAQVEGKHPSSSRCESRLAQVSPPQVARVFPRRWLSKKLTHSSEIFIPACSAGPTFHRCLRFTGNSARIHALHSRFIQLLHNVCHLEFSCKCVRNRVLPTLWKV